MEKHGLTQFDESLVKTPVGNPVIVRKPMLKRVRDFLKQYDQFAFAPVPRFVHEKQVSVRGLIGSIISVLLLVAYFGVSFERFLNGTPSVSQIQQPPDMDPVAFTPLGVVFRVNDAQGVPTTVFSNESYFKITASWSNVIEQDRYARVTTAVPVVPCDISSWAGWLGKQAWCPNETLQLRGRYQSPNYTFSRIDVIMCNPLAPYNASDGSGPVKCAPSAQIASTLINGRLNVLQYFDSQVPQETPSWEANMFLLNPYLYARYEQSYAVRYTNVNADYFRTWSDSTYQSLQYVSEKYYGTALSNAAAGGTYVLTLYFRLGSFNINEVNQIQTSMDYLGQLWAFFGLVLAVFALYFLRYNENKFYEQNPGWDEIDSQFRSRHDREHENEMQPHASTVVTAEAIQCHSTSETN